MGEEEKKPEEKKPEEPKQEKKEPPKAEKPSDDKKVEKKTEESKESKDPPPPPQEIVLRVFMHCEGCAKKVRKCLKGFDGVEDVQTDCKAHKVVVKGEKADPLKVLERVQRKSHGQVELLSPIPKPPAEEPKKAEEKGIVKPEEKKVEPQVIIVVLKAHMHCEACAQEIKKRIQKMKGVESADPDLTSSQVTVKGVFEPSNLVDYVYKRTGKQAVIVKQEPEKKEEEKGKEEKKAEDGGDKDGKKAEEGGGGGGSGGEEKEKKEGGEEAAKSEVGPDEMTVVDLKRNEFNYYYHYLPQNFGVYPSSYATEFYEYAPAPPPDPAPQIFSDENPNACSVM